MKVRLQLFAVAKQLAGSDELLLEVPAGGTVADLREALANNVPKLRPLVSHLRFAINAEYGTDSMAIPAGADVACIPPVSGG